MVRVASSNLVSRSKRRVSKAVIQRIANSYSPVRLWNAPPQTSCPGGEIGRHKGLKIPRTLKVRTGSTPVPGTNSKISPPMAMNAFLNNSLDDFSKSVNSSISSSSLEASAMSVSRFVSVTNNALQNFGQAVVIGEISEIKTYSHLYFKLKDETAAVDCLMFASVLNRLSFIPKIGMRVVVVGKSSIYLKTGQFKLIAEKMIVAGAGKIMEELLALKEKLQKEGVFEAIKRPIPKWINKVGIITSKEGHVLHDMLTVLNKRNPGIEVVVYPCQVQGTEAPATIVNALNTAFRDNFCDVLIVGRGGGSFEDLLPFSDESVVRTIINSPMPIISAVGHEPDAALSDFAADLRAPTPTAAADIVSSYTVEMMQKDLDSYALLLGDLVYKKLDDLKAVLEKTEIKLKSFGPESLLNLKSSYLNSLNEKITRLIFDRLTFSKAQTDSFLHRLQDHDPKFKLNSFELTINELEKRLEFTVNDEVAKTVKRIDNAMLSMERAYFHQDMINADKKIETIKEKLISLNPLLVLKRGYSVTLDKKGKSADINTLKINDEIKSLVAGGQILSVITKIEKD